MTKKINLKLSVLSLTHNENALVDTFSTDHVLILDNPVQGFLNFTKAFLINIEKWVKSVLTFQHQLVDFQQLFNLSVSSTLGSISLFVIILSILYDLPNSQLSDCQQSSISFLCTGHYQFFVIVSILYGLC